MNGYGKKGGTSANSGKKAAVYRATLPDGTVVRKRSFYVDADEAFIGAFEYGGRWYAAGVTDKATADGHPIYYEEAIKSQTALRAVRIK